MSGLALVAPADSVAREQALDTSRSILVQAPAGSGKTELLATRYLKLLAEVDEPEEILAITFTRAATAEMRHRILKKLEQATLPAHRIPKEDLASLPLARAALARSEACGWRLLDQPQRLDIQTIDSLCLRIARQLPLAAKLGGTLNPTERAERLYRQAARNTFDRLGGDGAEADVELAGALEALLLLRDGNLANCESLLAKMLQTRDQWAHAFLLSGEVDWESVRASMQAPFEREIDRVLHELHDLLSATPKIVAELLELANYACDGAELEIEIRLLAGLTDLPPLPDFVEHWRCLSELLLTKSSELRKRFTVKEGFPSEGREEKKRMMRLVGDLRKNPEVAALLCEIRQLPPNAYSDEQWRTLRHIFTALRRAVAELKAVFAREGAVDFVEIGMSALEVLRGEVAETRRVRHLLVDEFQDTSRRQHELLASLLRDWTNGDGRTVFLVGDPMQSIYLFRQADVELFDIARHRGFASALDTLKLHPLQLRTNFRSSAELVNPLNAMFKLVFPHQAKHQSAGVDFLASVAPGADEDRERPGGAYEVHPAILEKKTAGDNDQRDAWKQDRQREIAEIVAIVQRHMPRIQRAAHAKGGLTVAILGRAKNHLTPIAAALRRSGIPFRAVELETLDERQEILDLQSIVRALLHPMDRIAWLSLLRAPWCGLDLADLHCLCGTDEPGRSRPSVEQQIESRLHLVGEEARERVVRVLAAIDAARRHRYATASFSSWIERAWTTLGGPACVDAEGYENALAYFAMLDDIAPDGIAATGEEMAGQLGRLFAKPDPNVGERCGVQLMTIHKAKGLGFNVVIVPALHKTVSQNEQPLVQFLERATGEGTELLVAPLGEKGAATDTLYAWVCKQKKNRETEERKRLLYVACTRAREELHLFATATATNSGPRPKEGSLLSTAWPAWEFVFNERAAFTAASNVIDFPAAASSTKPMQGVFDFAAAAEPSTLRRLPLDWKATPSAAQSRQFATASVAFNPRNPEDPVADREHPHAGRARRILGSAVHLLFEQATRLLEQGATEAVLREKLPQLRGKAESFAWNEGLVKPEAAACAAEAIAALESAMRDEVGLWLLSPHPQAQTETSWTGILDGAPATLRIDRSFLAGDEPLAEAGETLWIVDYKTASRSSAGAEEFLDAERRQYQDQLERYGRMMRLAQGPELKLKLGLYYPFLRRLISWSG